MHVPYEFAPVVGGGGGGGGEESANKSVPKILETHWKVQPCYQALSSLPPLVIGRKTRVAAGHKITCDTNFSMRVESMNNF